MVWNFFAGRDGCDRPVLLSNSGWQTWPSERINRRNKTVPATLVPSVTLSQPFRAAFLTGRLPIRYGVAANNSRIRVTIWNSVPTGLPETELSFANVLRSAGYRTGLIGKWHLGINCNNRTDHCYLPVHHGFDSWFGIPLTNIRDCADDGGSVFVPGGQWLLDDLSVSSATLFIFLTFLHLVKLISWPLHRIVLVGAIPQLLNLFVQFGFHNFMRYTSCQLWQNETIIESPYSLENMTQVWPWPYQAANQFTWPILQAGLPRDFLVSWAHFDFYRQSTSLTYLFGQEINVVGNPVRCVG